MKLPSTPILKIALYLLLLPLLLTISCLQTTQTENVAPASLHGKWKLEAISYRGKADVRPPQDTPIWINFNKERLYSGYRSHIGNTYWMDGQATVNTYLGEVEVSSWEGSGSMSLTGISSTEIGSTRAGDMELEQEYLSLLSNARSYIIYRDTLIILCRNGEKLAYSRLGN